MLFEDVICALCVLYTYELLWACFVFFWTKGISVREFVGGAMQTAVPKGGLGDVAMVGPVGRPPEMRYSSINGIEIINVFIILC